MTTEQKVEKREHLWRCPKDGALYSSPDVCNQRCWLRKGQQEKHQPVTRTTTIVVTEGHSDDI